MKRRWQLLLLGLCNLLLVLALVGIGAAMGDDLSAGTTLAAPVRAWGIQTTRTPVFTPTRPALRSRVLFPYVVIRRILFGPVTVYLPLVEKRSAEP